MITGSCKVNILISGPTSFASIHTRTYSHAELNLIHIINMVVSVIGPVTLSVNIAHNIMLFQYCDVSFSKNIIFQSNHCTQVIDLLLTYIKIMEYANISFIDNKYINEVIKSEDINDNKLYPLCISQFITLRNTTTVSPLHYSINIVDNFYSHHPLSYNMHHKNCLISPFYRFTPHCQWIPTGVFYDYTPKEIYQQIVRNDNQNFTYHKICYCSTDEGSNCSAWSCVSCQTLETQLFTPCSDEISVVYAEVNSIHLPNSACKVATQHNKLTTITNFSKPVNFTIVSESISRCQLFLTASSYSNKIHDAFYVELLPCPIGFILQNGICDCDCDPVLSPYIDQCYIDYSAIRRPANTWITAYSQTNNNKCFITDCPMDYCLPYSVNLLHPDLQCQFNRTGILCSQCQHHLSMVFGSSRCMECTNLHILITIIVIVAGIVLVVLIYLLNLTVTIGTISGIIFYANVVSNNDSVLLTNDNVFKPLRVFISFINLDLGIETCFYNGMDSYSKMWLQLFFPLYRIAQNFGGDKLWRIWRNKRHSPLFYPTKFQVHYCN